MERSLLMALFFSVSTSPFLSGPGKSAKTGGFGASVTGIYILDEDTRNMDGTVELAIRADERKARILYWYCLSLDGM
jgi:hypothetical protein